MGIGETPAFKDHGLVTAARRFWDRVVVARADCGEAPPKAERLNLLHQCRSAHHELCLEVEALQLPELAKELRTSV